MLLLDCAVDGSSLERNGWAVCLLKETNYRVSQEETHLPQLTPRVCPNCVDDSSLLRVETIKSILISQKQ